MRYGATWMTLITLLSSPTAATALDVYIVAGQSNGYRLSTLRPGSVPIPGKHQIYYYGMSCTSEPESSTFRVLDTLDDTAGGTELALALVELSQDSVVFVQYCRCGSAVWRRRNAGWFPGDDPQAGDSFDSGLFARFERYVRSAEQSARSDLGLDWEVKALFWHQGESDSAGNHYLSYERNLRNLFWRFRKLLGPSLPIVVGEIRELDDGDRAINRILGRISRDDPKVALARAADLTFDRGLLGQPDVHLSLEGCRELGRRMAAAYAALSAEPR